LKAERAVQAEAREEAAQRPVRAIAIAGSALIVVLLIAALYVRNRAEAIAALTPTATHAPTHTPTPLPTFTPSPTPPFTMTPPPPREYEIQPGDTIFYIADIFQTAYTDILAFNNLNENSVLQVGQKILIPPPTQTPTPSSTPPEGTPPPNATPGQIVHIIQPGETLIQIAQRYGVAQSAIMSLNNIPDPNQIVAGQSLIIPQGSTPTPDALATATPLPSYGAVRLLHPLDGNRVVGNGMPVLLQWLSSGILRDDETYRVTVDQVDGSIRLPPVYIKATALHVLPDLFPPPGDPNRSLRWTVTIMRQVGVGSDGTPLYQVVSPSASRTFQWIVAPPTPTLTPEPGLNTP
jgi:LysM repeat protein